MGQTVSDLANAAGGPINGEQAAGGHDFIRSVKLVAQFEAQDGLNQHEFHFSIQEPGATAGWLLTQAIEQLEREHPEAPPIVGLKVLRARPSKASLSNVLECLPTCVGEPLRGGNECAAVTDGCMPVLATFGLGDDVLVLDYDLPLEEALSGGYGFEAVFEVREADGSACCFTDCSLGSSKDANADQKRNRIDEFGIVRTLGIGGTGRVFQATHKPTGQMRALKVMSKARIFEQDQRLQRVVTEKRILARLRHPFVVSLHWAFQTGTHLFLVLDFCGGGELFYHLLQRTKFEDKDAMFYFSEILLGVEYLHSQEILYRDLKPENCMLDNEGHIRLTDFGLSKDGLTKSALFTSFVGTAGYLSPEMIARSGHGMPVDYYCLGCLNYCLLTGSLPHYEGDYKAMIERRMKGEPCMFPPWITPSAQDLITGLLAPNPAARIGSRGGAAEVKEHAWLAAVDWTKVYRREPQPCFPNFPPILPSKDIATNFASEFTAQPAPADLRGIGKAEGSCGVHPEVKGFSDEFDHTIAPTGREKKMDGRHDREVLVIPPSASGLQQTPSRSGVPQGAAAAPPSPPLLGNAAGAAARKKAPLC